MGDKTYRIKVGQYKNDILYVFWGEIGGVKIQEESFSEDEISEKYENYCESGERNVSLTPILEVRNGNCYSGHELLYPYSEDFYAYADDVLTGTDAVEKFKNEVNHDGKRIICEANEIEEKATIKLKEGDVKKKWENGFQES